MKNLFLCVVISLTSLLLLADPPGPHADGPGRRERAIAPIPTAPVSIQPSDLQLLDLQIRLFKGQIEKLKARLSDVEIVHDKGARLLLDDQIGDLTRVLEGPNGLDELFERLKTGAGPVVAGTTPCGDLPPGAWCDLFNNKAWFPVSSAAVKFTEVKAVCQAPWHIPSRAELAGARNRLFLTTGLTTDKNAYYWTAESVNGSSVYNWIIGLKPDFTETNTHIETENTNGRPINGLCVK